MRLGIVLPADGLLASPAAVETTAWAAQELDYASVWSASTDVLRTAGRACALPLGLLLGPGGADGPSIAGSGTRQERDLDFVAGPLAGRRAAPWTAPPLRVLESGPLPPAPGAADGWCPRLHALAAATGWTGLLLVRLFRVPDRQELEQAAAAGAEQVLVHLPAATLDEQLAGFAEAAEAVAAHSPPVRSGTVDRAGPGRGRTVSP